MKKVSANLIAMLFAVACVDANAADTVKPACVQTANAATTAKTAKTADPNSGMPNRISMNVTVPKQTQGATFGEKVNQGLHAAGGALAQGAAAAPTGGNDCDDAAEVARKDKTGSSDASAGGGAGTAAAAAEKKTDSPDAPASDRK